MDLSFGILQLRRPSTSPLALLCFGLQGCHSSPLSSKDEPAWPRESEVWLVQLRCKNILMLRRCRSLVHGLAATALPSQFNFRLRNRVCHRLGVWVLVCQGNK